MPCDVRQQLIETYSQAEDGSAKKLNIFMQLFRHEEKHGCGKRLAQTSEVPTLGVGEADLEQR